MAMSSGGGNTGGNGALKSEKLKQGIMLDTVTVRETNYEVKIPKVVYENKTYEIPIVKEKSVETVKYRTVEKETVKYVPKEEETTRYKTVEVPCEKPVIVEQTYEKPKIVEREYEKPTIRVKEYEVVNIKDLGIVQDYVKASKELAQNLVELKKRMDEIREYKLVEQVVKVPKIEYHTVKVERIEWVPVRREMPNAD